MSRWYSNKESQLRQGHRKAYEKGKVKISKRPHFSEYDSSDSD